MIKELVKAWVRSSKDKEVKMQRFIVHDSIESRINSYWKKERINQVWELYCDGTSDIDSLMMKLLINY